MIVAGKQREGPADFATGCESGRRVDNSSYLPEVCQSGSANAFSVEGTKLGYALGLSET